MAETAGMEDPIPVEAPNEVPMESLETAAELSKTEGTSAPDELTTAPPEQGTESATKAAGTDVFFDAKEASQAGGQNGEELKNGGGTTNETPAGESVPLPVENVYDSATKELEEAVTNHADKIIAETTDQDVHQVAEGTKNENQAGESAAPGNDAAAKPSEGDPKTDSNEKLVEDAAAKASEDVKQTEEDSKPAAAEGESTSEGKVILLPDGTEAKIDDRPVHVKRGEVLKRPQDVTSVVTRNGKTWNEMFNILEEYKKVHGDTYVPDRFKWDGVCLGLWVRNQRRREASLTEEQHKRLTDLGLDWQTQNERFDNVWHERYAKLTEYRVEHGDCKVPYTYKKDPALAKWVSQQRAQQAQGRLASDRKAKLDAIDFSWKLNTVKNRNTKTEDKKWQKQFDKLKEFREEHGHCKVPDRYKPDRPLGTWVKKQRLANACNQLKEDRKKMLDDIGFVWRITDKTDGEKWDRMFDQLKSYKTENGTCHVSRTVPDSDLKPLARWVKTQRALYKCGKILDDRKERLESIHFVWDGTQLPIKRKRRRQSEEGELKENGEPKAKTARTDDASTDEEGDDEKKMAAQLPALKTAPVIVEEAKVAATDSKPKASEDVAGQDKATENGGEKASATKETPSTGETKDKESPTANPSAANEDGPVVASKTNGELVDSAPAVEATEPAPAEKEELMAIAEGILADNPVIDAGTNNAVAEEGKDEEVSSPPKGEAPSESVQPAARSTRSKRNLPVDQTAQSPATPTDESNGRRKKPRIKYSA